MKNVLAGKELSRELGLGSAIVLVVANMVGTGVFTTSGFALAEVGSPAALLACWAVGGLFALAGALCYAELGAMLPEAGGEYVYLRRAFGPLPAFLSGWVSLVVGFSAPIAAAAIGFSTYLIGSAQPSWLTFELGGRRWLDLSATTVSAMAVVVVLSLVHYHSLKFGRRVQNALTAFKILFLVALVVGGFAFGRGDAGRLAAAFTPEGLGLAGPGFAVSLIFVSFAYSGWNAATYLGGEIRQPGRNLPLALLAGTAFVTLLYLLLNLLYVYALPETAMRGVLEVGSSAATALFGPTLGSAVGYAVAAGLLSVVSAMIMAGPRVYYAMARDGAFFPSFGVLSAAHHTPARSIFLQATIACVLILTATFETLLIYIGFVLSLCALLTVAGLLRLRRTEPDLPRPYRAFGYPFTPWFFIVGNVWIAVHSIGARPVVALASATTLGLGALLFATLRRRAARLHHSSSPSACSSTPSPEPARTPSP